MRIITKKCLGRIILILLMKCYDLTHSVLPTHRPTHHIYATIHPPPPPSPPSAVPAGVLLGEVEGRSAQLLPPPRLTARRPEGFTANCCLTNSYLFLEILICRYDIIQVHIISYNRNVFSHTYLSDIGHEVICLQGLFRDMGEKGKDFLHRPRGQSERTPREWTE